MINYMDKYDNGMIYIEDIAFALEGDYSPYCDFGEVNESELP